MRLWVGAGAREADRLMDGALASEMRSSIRRIPDFPKKGIVFRDITTLWKDPALLKKTVDAIYEHYRDRKVDKVLGIEARGFVFGALLAERFGVGTEQRSGGHAASMVPALLPSAEAIRWAEAPAPRGR